MESADKSHLPFCRKLRKIITPEVETKLRPIFLQKIPWVHKKMTQNLTQIYAFRMISSPSNMFLIQNKRQQFQIRWNLASCCCFCSANSKCYFLLKRDKVCTQNALFILQQMEQYLSHLVICHQLRLNALDSFEASFLLLFSISKHLIVEDQTMINPRQLKLDTLTIELLKLQHLRR